MPTHDWGWPAQPDAAGYEVAFKLGGRTVYHTLTMQTDVTLPPTFHFRAGTYRWSVRALPAKPGARPIVDSTFVLTKAAAAAANAS